MTALEVRNERISEVILVLCEANAILRSCASCGTDVVGLTAAQLLTQLQTDYPAMSWDADLVTEITDYMRARGIVIFVTPYFYLDYFMAKKGGPNIAFATLCPVLYQVCTGGTSQMGKFSVCTVQDCGTDDPAAGCCPPLQIT